MATRVPVELGFCPLGRDAPPEARRWLGQLAEYSAGRLPEPQRPSSESGPLLDVSLVRLAGPDQAPWSGMPFMLVGTRAEVLGHIQKGGVSRQWYIDHGYYWILSDADDDDLIPGADRPIMVDWSRPNYNIVTRRLQTLRGIAPGFAGLSVATHQMRQEIRRIARRDGPGDPVFILGESGVGKTQVARALHTKARGTLDGTDGGGFQSVSCRWFSPDDRSLHRELLGSAEAEPGAAADRAGLLESLSKGTVFLEDIESAPLGVRGTLLRLMDGAEGGTARFPRLGDTGTARETGTWLLFSTERDLATEVRRGSVAPEFVYKARDRVLHIHPLRDRSLDIPAISRVLWEQEWRKQERAQDTPPGPRRPLPASVLHWLAEQKLPWTDNVRALRTLWSLTVAILESNLPTIRSTLESILEHGPELYDWIGIVAAPSGRTDPSPEGDRRVSRVLSLDVGHDSGPPARAWPTTGSETEAHRVLAGQDHLPGADDRLRENIESHDKRELAKVRRSVRLSRIICFLDIEKSITVADGIQLTEISHNKVREDFTELEGLGLVGKERRGRMEQWFATWKPAE